MPTPDDTIGDLIAHGYDVVADAYAALESPADPWPRMARVRAFMVGVTHGSSVLDLGCGNGSPATLELSATHRVTGVDISAEQIARARANVPAATFLWADARRVEFPAESFDAILGLYLLDHIPAAEHAEVFANLARWLRPGGRILLSAEPGSGEGGVYEWLGVPVFLETVPVEQIVTSLELAGLAVAAVDVEAQREGGREIEFAWITALKASSGAPL